MAQRALAFEFKDIESMSGCYKPSLGVPFIRSELGGIVTVLEEERVNEYESFKSPWVYYLPSGLGEALDVPKEGPSDLSAIFCPNWKASLSGIKDTGIVSEWKQAARDVMAVEMELFGVYSAAS